MGLYVQANLFRWLQTMGFAKDGRRTNDNKIQLSEQVSMKLFDGVLIAMILKEHGKVKTNEHALQKLDAIKQNSTPAIRLYNWNIIAETLKKMGFNLQYAQKSKILNLESQALLKVLLYLNENQQEQPQSPQNTKSLQVDITQISKKQLRDASNILQFFVISISKNFKLSPQHTLNLFLDSNKYLAHLLVKGIKGSFDPIHAFLSDILSNMDYIVVTLFCFDEKQSLTFFLNGVKPALISKQVSISQTCITILNQLQNTYKINSMSFSLAENWMKQEGINTVFFAIKRHFQMVEQYLNLAYLFLGEYLYNFIQPTDKSSLWENDFQKLSFFMKFLSSLDIENILEFSEHKAFFQWIKLLVKLIKKVKEPKEILVLMNIFQWLWMNMERSFETNENGLPNAYFAFLKNTSLHTSELVFYESIRTMFSLMQELGTRKNSYAPFFYRILINCLNFATDINRIEYLAINFKQAFKNINNLPGGPLVEPILKNLQKDISLNCIDLCKGLLEENRLNEEELIDIVDILTRIIFHDPQYGNIALDIIFDNISNMNEEMIQGFVENNSKNSLAHFYSITKSITRKFVDLKSDFQRYGKDQSMKKGGAVFSQQIQKHITLGYLVKFMEKCIEQSEQVKQEFEPMLFHTYIRVKDELSKPQQAGLLIPLMKYYYPAQDELQAKIKAYLYEINPPKQPTPPPKLKSESSLDKLKKSKLGKSSDFTEKPKTPKAIQLSTLKPSLYALKDLEKVKKKKQILKTQGQNKIKEKDFLDQKKQLFRSILNQKRLIEFGGKSLLDKQYKCVYEWGSMKEESQNKVHGIPNIKLLNIATEEETSFAEDVDSMLKKYRKIWRFLFFKYSTFGAKKQQFKTQQKINIADILKMHRQYEMTFLKKQQSQAIVRLINQNMKRKTDNQNLTYLGFQQYIFQASNYGYSKIGYANLSPGQRLGLFLNQLKKVTGQKGGSVELFQNPEEVYFQETQVIKEFNKRLQENPQYILPQGYKKVSLVELKYDYEIHPVNFVKLSESYQTVLEVLDEIFSEKQQLGFHLIEPLTHKEEKLVAKPSLFQNLNQKMKEYKGGYLQPKKSPTTADKKEREKKAVGFKNQYHPLVNFSLGIKLGLAGVSLKNRFIGDEVAYWMDDMLDAVEKQSLVVENKGKKKINNEALKKKRASLHKLKIQQQQQQKKYKKRVQSVKVEVQANREKKKQEDKTKRQQRRIFRKAQKQRQLSAMKKKMNEFETAKKKLQEKRKQQEAKRKAEYSVKKKQKQQYKKGVEEYFQKKKQQLEQKQVNYKKVKEEEEIKEKQKQQKQKQFVKKLHYNILKNQQSVLEKIETTKKSYGEVWISEEIQNAFTLFQPALQYLFQLLLKYEKSKISATNLDQISLNTLHFFTLKFRIMPFMLEKNALTKIFKAVCKNNISITGINYTQFQQTLFRIAVKAKQLLNNIIQRRNSKVKQGTQENQQEKSQLKPSRLILQSPKKFSLTDDYLFNAEGVTQNTVKQLLRFLNLPKDRQGVEERYREAIETKNIKPTSILKKQLQDQLI